MKENNLLIQNNKITVDISNIPSPAFIVDIEAIRKNLEILNLVKKNTGAKILLALKAFSMFSTFDVISKTLDGVCASGFYEAKLGFEKFKKEVHTFSPAYKKDDLEKILKISNHVIFNTPAQYERFKYLCTPFKNKVKFGIRINPECSTGKVPIYDPCVKFSRLGSTVKKFENFDFESITGFHFHTLCEQDSKALEVTLKAVEEKFGKYLKFMEFVNFGGGHHITREDYDMEHLCYIINNFKKKYDVEVYLEPGEAVVLNAGIYVTEILDIMNNEMDIAIIDGSAATHLPDVLEMPYRPHIIDSAKPGEKKYTYRIGGNSCLAGDIIGDYSFDEPLKIGDKLIFTDMALYTMVKTNTFNGVKLPSLYIYENSKIKLIKNFGYNNFKNRLS